MSLTVVIRHAMFSYWNRNARTRTQRIHTCLQVECTNTFLNYDFHDHSKEERCLLGAAGSTFLLVPSSVWHEPSPKEKTWAKGKNAKLSYGQHTSKPVCCWDTDVLFLNKSMFMLQQAFTSAQITWQELEPILMGKRSFLNTAPGLQCFGENIALCRAGQQIPVDSGIST